MVWAKIDDAILDNEKIVRAGALGFALHIAAITYCCRNLTDGFIPRIKVRGLLDFSGVVQLKSEGQFSDSYAEANALEIAKQNEFVGLWIWDEDRDGWWLHDFTKYNPRRSEVLANRSELSKIRAEAGRRGGQAKRKQTRSKTEANSEAKRKQTRSKTEANSEAKRKQNRSPEPVPVPVPVTNDPPVVPQASPSSERRFQPGTTGQEARERFEVMVSEATNRPFALDGAPYHTTDLCKLLNKHAPPGDLESALAWLKITVRDWVSSVDPQFAGGYAPSKLLAWLNADRPKPRNSVTQLRTGTDDVPLRPSRRLIRDEDLE